MASESNMQSLPAFFTTNLAAAIWAGISFDLTRCLISTIYAFSLSATLLWTKTNNASFPLLGARRISFQLFTFSGVSFNTSLTLIPHLAISPWYDSWVFVLKITSSMVSFVTMLQWFGFPGRYSFRRIDVAQAFWRVSPRLIFIKLKKAFRWK